MTQLPVVVGVDDSSAARSAVLWAAEEAALAGTRLLIVHCPVSLATPGSAIYAEAVLRAADDVGRVLLQSMVVLARAQQPDIQVSTLLSHSEPAQALVDVSVEAHMVVLGSTNVLRGEASLLGSKRMMVTAHARCPVLLPGPASNFNMPANVSRVVVGATDTHAGRAATRWAAAEAFRRNVTLQLVSVGESRPAEKGEASARGSSVRVLLDPLAAVRQSIRLRYPELALLDDTIAGDPAEVLTSYSDGHSIVVVGCHHSDDQWSTRLGPVATAVVHRSRGPIMVVGAVNPTDDEG